MPSLLSRRWLPPYSELGRANLARWAAFGLPIRMSIVHLISKIRRWAERKVSWISS